jgi:polar amino acid transport system substrate-binding protein
MHFARHPLLARGLALAATFAALATLGTSAQADTLADIKARKKIQIAVDIGVPPYGMADANLKPTGSDVETAQLLAKDLGVEMELVPVTGPNRVPFLLTGKADIVVASFSINEERKRVIDFSLPYGEVQVAIAAPATAPVKAFADLTGKRVVVTRGTTADKALTTGNKDAQIVRYDDDATLITAVVAGQADIAATTPSIVQAINAKRPPKPLEVRFVMQAFPYGIGLRKGEDNLRQWLDGWVKANLANGKLDAIYRKYHGNGLPASLTKAGG